MEPEQWIKPGVTVPAVSRWGVTEHTITRLTETQIVMVDGTRWSRVRLSPIGSYGASGRHLVPPGSPEHVGAARRDALTRLSGELASAANATAMGREAVEVGEGIARSARMAVVRWEAEMSRLDRAQSAYDEKMKEGK